MIHTGTLASRAPNQGLESSFCCWTAEQGLAQKGCFLFTDTGIEMSRTSGCARHRYQVAGHLDLSCLAVATLVVQKTPGAEASLQQTMCREFTYQGIPQRASLKYMVLYLFCFFRLHVMFTSFIEIGKSLLQSRSLKALDIGRGIDTVGNPHRTQIYQFELFELKLLNSSFSSLSPY